MSGREIRFPSDDAAPLTNSRIAGVLAEIADLIDIKGETPYKVAAYRRASDSVARCPVEVAAAYRAGDPPELRGVGGTLSERILELSTSGRLGYLDALRAEVPPTLLELLAIPGVGPRTVGEVWRTLGIATLPELEAAARDGRLRQIRGISVKTEARIVEGIGDLARRPPRRMLMGEAHAVADRIADRIAALPGVESVVVAGSVRRGRETVGDLDLLIETGHPGEAMAAIAESDLIDPTGTGGPLGGSDRATLQLREGPQLDVMAMPVEAAGSYLIHLTGSADHNVALRHRARERGWSLSERGVTPLDEHDAEPRRFATEGELYAFLGLDEIPPELREGQGEVEAAAAGQLPNLVRRADLRGDCHSHSHWSDGREPLEVMVESARQAGREYQVLTDHSWSLSIANGLSPDEVERQRREIGGLNERFERERAAGELPNGAHPQGFRLLHGTELEITTDGRLDYDDALLASLDVVVASLHVGRRQPRAQLMARYDVAMHNPHVDIISHPTGRKIGRRPELDLDWDAFYRTAAETGTLLEINGSEARLDLDEHRIRAAIEAGCRFVIDSDAHDRKDWQNLDRGTTIARRGWLSAALVANALPLDAFLDTMGEKPHAW
jgi:DNA polymerase (family 10)